MTVHHIMSEKDQKASCPYCGRCTQDHKWESQFHDNAHYKEQHCECGRKLSIKMDFMGTGHDSWNLDRKIAEADSKSQKK
jgi:hypothetical protein